MNAQKVVKFNLYMSCILLATFILMFIGVSLAYFTSFKQASATFISGTVELTLVESEVIPDEAGNLVKDPTGGMIVGKAEEVVNDYGRVYPGMTICKDPTITNTGDKPEWIAAKVTFTDGRGDLHKIMGYSGYEEIDIEKLLAGGLLDEHVELKDWNGISDVCINEKYAMIQKASQAEGKYEFFFLMLKPLDVGEQVTLFDKVEFNQMWNNAQMQELVDLKINVQAFGVQTFQMNDCLHAMVTAFPEHFPFDADIK